jgi:hypothetical protein
MSKVKTGYYIGEKTLRQLRRLAALDHRTLSGEIEWLVEREWARRGVLQSAGGRERDKR